MRHHGHMTYEQKKGYVEAYLRIIEKCKDNKLEPPAPTRIAKSLGLSYQCFLNYLREFNVPYKKRDKRGGAYRHDSPLEMDV